MSFKVSVRNAADLTARDIDAWKALEASAIEPNGYLSPNFILPALKHLEPTARVVILMVERSAAVGGPELVGLGVFRVCSANRRFPLPHLQAYLSEHSYLSGLLIDNEHARGALDALLDHVRGKSWQWHGITFERCWSDGPLAELLADYATAHQRSLHVMDEQSRAVLRMPVDPKAHMERVSSSLRGNIKRRLRRLGEQGEVVWRAHRPEGIPAAAVEAFLALEHQGWKGENGTSLRSAASHELFFKDMVQRFAADGRALFCEMAVNDQVIVSTSNFISGSSGFAFKVGWNPEHAKMSPGVLCEAEFLRESATVCPDLTAFDSGASPGSYMEDIWPDRRILHTSSIGLSRIGKLALDVVDLARNLKERHATAQADQPAPEAPPPESTEAPRHSVATAH